MSSIFSFALAALALGLAWPAFAEAPADGPGLGFAVAQTTSASPSIGFDAVVEPVRQTVVASQVSGAVVQLDVRVGDRVKAGQLLLRIDSRAADQNAAASEAQVLATRASLEAATQELERQKQLFAKSYISEA